MACSLEASATGRLRQAAPIHLAPIGKEQQAAALRPLRLLRQRQGRQAQQLSQVVRIRSPRATRDAHTPAGAGACDADAAVSAAGKVIHGNAGVMLYTEAHTSSEVPETHKHLASSAHLQVMRQTTRLRPS